MLLTVVGLFVFTIVYFFTRGLLQYVPVLTILPHHDITYRDDNGLCYVYDRLPCSP